ncbi:circadian clock-controlled protein daywake-like [Aricia agestis]|uniref:circadian clock-controlled protein daywake-like n=1 Tax=Aricia agestis TaxID=91739 RepID=UPI001C20A0C7|nr:circadian clock-controlled protein daywake-like [Aricia agestis]XP_041979855.1 circadian clock-controlled protein daywake-like [Aricia agestis]
MRAILVLLLCSRAYAGSLPDYMRACSASDPELNKCIEDVIATAGPRFAKGIPDLGIASLDPVNLGTIYIDNPALNVTLTDTVLTGLSGFKINSFKMEEAKGRATLDFTANVTLKSQYVMDGQVLILPIRGDGDARIKITNLNIVIKYEFKTVDGYWSVPEYKESYKMGRAHFKFTNLFGGNKELASLTLQFMNDNWSTIIDEIAPPAVTQIIRRCVDEVRKLFAAVPADQLLLH